MFTLSKYISQDGSVERGMVWDPGSTPSSPGPSTYKCLNRWEPILSGHTQACCCLLLFFFLPIFSLCSHYFLYHYVPTFIYCPILYSVILPKGRSSVLQNKIHWLYCLNFMKNIYYSENTFFLLSFLDLSFQLQMAETTEGLAAIQTLGRVINPLWPANLCTWYAPLPCPE